MIYALYIDLNLKEIEIQLCGITKLEGVIVSIKGDSIINGSEIDRPFKQTLYFTHIYLEY